MIGMIMVFKALEIEENTNIFVSGTVLIAISACGAYINKKTYVSPPNQSADQLLELYIPTNVSINTPDDCPVCLELITFPHPALKCKQCEKVFHKKCLRQWFEDNTQCPHCRHE